MLLAASLKKVDAMQIELATMVKQCTEQVSCNLNGEIAILNLKSTLYFGLDGVGACIWEAMAEPKKVSDLCKRVLERFDVREEQCQEDIMVFLGILNDAGLVEILTRSKNNQYS